MYLKPTCGFQHTRDKSSLFLVTHRALHEHPITSSPFPAHSLSFHLEVLGLMLQPGLFCHQMSPQHPPLFLRTLAGWHHLGESPSLPPPQARLFPLPLCSDPSNMSCLPASRTPTPQTVSPTKTGILVCFVQLPGPQHPVYCLVNSRYSINACSGVNSKSSWHLWGTYDTDIVLGTQS